MSVHPSPALVVPADLSIGDCVRKMRDHHVGSVLVVRGSTPYDLIGIFTERDLVNRIDEIEHGGYWSKPVSTVDGRPAITLSIYEIDKASETMLRCGIEHIFPWFTKTSRGSSTSLASFRCGIFSRSRVGKSSMRTRKSELLLSPAIRCQVLKTLFSQRRKSSR